MFFNTDSIYVNADERPYGYDNNVAAVDNMIQNHVNNRFRAYCSASIQQLLIMLKDLDHLYISTNRIAYDYSTLQQFEPTGPNQFPPNIGSFTPKEDLTNRIDFIEIQKNATILNKVDTYNRDDRSISLMLQENVHHKVRVYKNETGKQIFVLTNKLTGSLVRRVIALIPKLWPDRSYNDVINSPEYAKILNYFVKDNPTQAECDEWEQVTSRWLESSPRLEEYQMKLFTAAINARAQGRIQQLQASYESTSRRYSDALDALGTYIITLERITNELAGLKENSNTPAKELMTYLKTNKAISEYKIVPNGLLITVETPLEYFNEDLIKAYLQKTNSIIMRKKDSFSKIDEFCKDIFLDNKYQLWFKTNFKIDFANATIHKSNEGTRAFDNSDLYEQPHLMHYDCWGNGGPKIVAAIRKNDYIDAIEQAIACCKNLNTGDGVVVENMIDLICAYKDKKSIADENGVMKSINELYYAPKTEPAPEVAPDLNV